MRKILMFMLSALLFINTTFASPIIYEKPDVKIIVEGTALELGAEVPIIVNSRTLVPLRKLLVGLGVPDNTTNIQWIGETREVKVIYNGLTIDLAIDSFKGYINGKQYTLDCAPIIYKDRTYLPARFVGEALGYTISWDQYTPAVIVTSNKNAQKIGEILEELNAAINNVMSYEVATVRNSNIVSTYEGEREEIKYVVKNLEKADLRKKIIYTENSYKDEFESSFNFSYNTQDAHYNCYKYLEDNTLYNTGWEKINYDPTIDIETPYESKEKLGLVNIDNMLYGSLVYKEYDNAYVISTVSSQIDLLKSLNGEELFLELSGNGVIKEFEYQLAISKDTKLPISVRITYAVEQEDVEDNFSSKEMGEYMIEFIEFNKYLDLKLPEIK